MKPANLHMDNGLRRLLAEVLGPVREDIKSLASKDYLDTKINDLEKRLLNKLKSQSKEIKTLRKEVADLQDRLEDAELAIDDGSSTVDGQGEKENACIKKVPNIGEEMEIKLSPDAIDRAHRMMVTKMSQGPVGGGGSYMVKW